MSEHVDAVVIGSGFGGSVSAYNLAKGGESVVLLERGRAYPPGSFPRSPAQMSRAFWSPGDGLYGMFDVWDFDGLDSVVSSGLGGGSLIYANVLLRKDERWFCDEELPDGGYERWPVSRADLDPHYERVEQMIGATPYPLDKPAYEDTAKTHAMQDAAAELGLDWRLPPLAVSFAPGTGAEPGLGLPIPDPAYGNLHGVRRTTCRLCGECDIGCNDGSKNSLDHTYLSAAAFHGADIRALHEVTAIRPRPGGGYEVDYTRHDPDAGKERDPETGTIGCDRLILAAGTYGTTYLLLRARKELPGLSKAIGSRFSGNGDLLTFLLDAKTRDRARPLDASRGPVITSAIRLPDDLDGGTGRGAYIEDGGYPAFVDYLVEGADMAGEVGRVARFVWERFKDFVTDAPASRINKELSDLLGHGALSVSSLPLLGMGRDVPDGRLTLRKDRLQAEWSVDSSRDYFDRVRKTMERMAHVLGATYHDNPTWFLKRVISVHPLGGAPMASGPSEGVCDQYGEVFGHPGLYIADGAALPGPVGANPSLTIAAFADRITHYMLHPEEKSESTQASALRRAEGSGDGGLLDGTGAGAAGVPGAGETDAEVPAAGVGAEAPSNGAAYGPGDHDRTSLSFTESMKGHYTAGVADPTVGEMAEGRERLAFELTITAEDVDRFLAEPSHTATAKGWVEAAALGGRRPVERGWFNLFAPADAPDRRLMKYRLFVTDDTGRARTLTGHKSVFHGPPTDIWPDTSTLYFTLQDGHLPEGPDGEIVGAGTLHILLTDFARQLTTFRTAGPHGAQALARFGRFFAGELWDVYRPERQPS